MKMKLILALLLTSFVLTGCATPAANSSSVADRDPLQIDTAHPPALAALNFDSYGDRINGILYQANGAGPHPTVILLHGYPGNEKNLDLAQSLRRAGYNVLFFHYRGAWGSSGEFSLTHVIEDVGSAADFLRKNANEYRVDQDRLLIIGHSMGGFAALQGAARDEAITCVAAIAPADVGLIAARFLEADAELAQRSAARADTLTMLNGWSGEKMIAERQANRDAFSLIDLAPNLAGKSVLLIAGDRDSVLAPDIFHTPLVAAYANQPNITLAHAVIPGDHAFSWSRFELTDTVLDWAQSCKPTP
ncbi:MAG: alpha/beta fold hydrolase [Acidimicrobiales bacterium]|nr:alpha/beta fold hydrolase [Hyphomonadaceae bacterium]RZV39839.1 MAG: alpha/beta fold hydrolase [Acidimicrobiales bacterium]